MFGAPRGGNHRKYFLAKLEAGLNVLFPMNRKTFPLFYVGFVLCLFLASFAVGSPRSHAPKHTPPTVFEYFHGDDSDRHNQEKANDSALFLIVLGISFGYIVPSVIAVCRMNPNLGPIIILNLALGWTLLGWLGALMWSLSSVTGKAQQRSA
jgi:hypothetical protein